MCRLCVRYVLLLVTSVCFSVKLNNATPWSLILRQASIYMRTTAVRRHRNVFDQRNETEAIWLVFCKWHFQIYFNKKTNLIKSLNNLRDQWVNPLRKTADCQYCVSWWPLAGSQVISRQHIDPNWLTHRGRVTHICVSNLTIIGSDNGLSPG